MQNFWPFSVQNTVDVNLRSSFPCINSVRHIYMCLKQGFKLFSHNSPLAFVDLQVLASSKVMGEKGLITIWAILRQDPFVSLVKGFCCAVFTMLDEAKGGHHHVPSSV